VWHDAFVTRTAPSAARVPDFSPPARLRSVGRRTIWHSGPLWIPDYVNDDDTIELSFRDLIELRFVKAFRDVGLSLPTIRECFNRAVEAVEDPRAFSTLRFRTDGSTIFLETAFTTLVEQREGLLARHACAAQA
jgi:hypothetical protein